MVVTSNPSRLLALPAELRLQIYSHVFSVPPTLPSEGMCPSCGARGINEDGGGDDAPRYPAGRIKIEILDTITSRRDDSPGQRVSRRLTAILQTCRQIHDEAIEVLYQQTLFRIALGAEGIDSLDATGRLLSPDRSVEARSDQQGDASPLSDLSLFHKMQNVHLDLNFGGQVNPIWDALPVIRAIVAELNPSRKHTTASLRFGLMTAITCVRLPETPWERWVAKMKRIDVGCVANIEVDKDVEKWTKYGQKRFDELRMALGGGEMRFMQFKEKLGPQDEGLRACVIL